MPKNIKLPISKGSIGKYKSGNTKIRSTVFRIRS
jgi:hypothetical protein